MRPHRSISTRDKVLACTALAGALLAAVLGGWAIHTWQSGHSTQDTPSDSAPQRKTLQYQGHTYVARDGVETYLFLGVDAPGPAQENPSYLGGGQADVQLLLVVDRPNRTWQVLQLNRDSMVEVPVLGVDGTEVGTQVQQLALAHAYGDGLEGSCENNVAAVSRLLSGQEIQGYLSLNMDGVSVLTDLVGGVPVTVLDDLDGLKKGEQVTLSGDQALAYVRGRQGVGDETNLSRMARQEQFAASLWERLKPLSPEAWWELYQGVEEYLVSDSKDRWMKLAQQISHYTALEPVSISGQSGLDPQGAAAYWLDEESLQQTVIQLFYQRVAQD